MQKSQYILCKIVIQGLKCRHNCFVLNISFCDISLLANLLHFCDFRTWNLSIRNKFSLPSSNSHIGWSFGKEKIFFQREVWKRTLCRGVAGRMSAILVRFYYSHGLWHDVHRHKFSEIPIHLKWSQFLKVWFSQHPSLNALGWAMSFVPIQVKHHIGETSLCGLLYSIRDWVGHSLCCWTPLSSICHRGFALYHRWPNTLSL